MEGLPFAPLAPVRERIVQSVLTIGVTLVIFSYGAAPPLVFAVMPMFAWLAFRGTLREASVLLLGVGVVATVATLLGFGPVHELIARYSLAPELVIGFLQLFLLDCALILLPLSVMTTQQRMSAARATSGQQTLQRLLDAATGSAVHRDRPRRPGRGLQPRVPRWCSGGAPTTRSASRPTGCSPTPSCSGRPPGVQAPADLRRHLRRDRRRRQRAAGLALPPPGRRAAHHADGRHGAARRPGRRVRLPLRRRGRHRAGRRPPVTAHRPRPRAAGGRQPARAGAGQVRLRGHRQPRAAYAADEHDRVRRAARGRRGRRAQRAAARRGQPGPAQRPPADADGRGPAPALADRGAPDDDDTRSRPTCATPPGRRTSPSVRCSRPASSTW